MKIAIVHDWLVVNGGAEKVLKYMNEIFDADIFSIVDFLSEKDRREILKGKFTKTSFIQNLPFARRYFRNYLFFFPKAIESFNLNNYDLIISSSWAFAKGVKKNKDQIHISYCYTPIRYVWDLEEEYLSNLIFFKRFFAKKVFNYIKKWDLESSKRVDYFIADSKFVKERIKRIYNRDANVIYPPIDLDKFLLCEKKEDFYLTVSRLVSYKKVDLIVKAFNEMPDKKLIVIGSGENLNYLRKIANKNVRILGYQSDEVVIRYMQKAKGFVYAALEDYGIVPREALSCGTPVIAFNKGGVVESIVEGVNGVLFKNQSVKDIKNAIKEFEKMNFDYKKVRKSVENLSIENFKKSLLNFIEDKINLI